MKLIMSKAISGFLQVVEIVIALPNGAVTFLQAEDVPRPQLFLHQINDLLQRLHLGGRGQIILKEGLE